MKNRRIELDPSELKAIEGHKWYLSEQSGREVSIEEAIADFRKRYRAIWLGAKLHAENRKQIEEILRHKWNRSTEVGFDIGEERAAREWIQWFADIWRQEKESLEGNGFQEIKLEVEKDEGLGIKPAAPLSEIARTFDCDLFLHFPGMEFYNFILHGKEYLSVKSVIFPDELSFRKDDRIEFIAMGLRVPELFEELKSILFK